MRFGQVATPVPSHVSVRRGVSHLRHHRPTPHFYVVLGGVIIDFCNVETITRQSRKLHKFNRAQRWGGRSYPRMVKFLISSIIACTSNVAESIIVDKKPPRYSPAFNTAICIRPVFAIGNDPPFPAVRKCVDLSSTWIGNPYMSIARNVFANRYRKRF